MDDADPPKVNAATLAKLGAEPLAELLAAAAKADPALKRTLALEVMSEACDLADEIDRQLHRMRTAPAKLKEVAPARLTVSRMSIAARASSSMISTWHMDDRSRSERKTARGAAEFRG